jgi:hypothetical protein
MLESVIIGVAGIGLAGLVALVYCIGRAEEKRIGGRYNVGTTVLGGGEAFRVITRPRLGVRPDEKLSRELQRRQDALKSRSGASRG